MVVVERVVGAGRGKIPTSPLTGEKLPYGTAYKRVSYSDGAMGVVTVADIERRRICGRKTLAVQRGGVQAFRPTDGRGNKYGVEVRLTIPAQPHRLELRALLMVSGFKFKGDRYDTEPVTLDAGSWTAFLQSHAGDADVEIYVRDRKTGLEYCCNLATVNPKSAEITAIQQAHGTSTNSDKCRKADKPVK